jgi:Asp-tRNA(Asn)/Glu-tRNA(Gln) amidotransferase A subunit family amidase
MSMGTFQEVVGTGRYRMRSGDQGSCPTTVSPFDSRLRTIVERDPYNAVITWVDEPAPPRTGPLAGRTLLVKDLIDTAGLRTTYGSRIYAEHVPATSAPVVDRLVAAGAVVIGKANLDEFAWGVMGQNPWYGTVRNPLRPGRTAGGSSAGNAAALAAGLVDLGLGTDTGCSIRLPSACCDTVGLKSQWGRIPTTGVRPLVPSLDTVGPMARSVADVAVMWSALTGAAVPEPRLSGLTVGLVRIAPVVGDEQTVEDNPAAEAYAEDLQRLGARVVEARIPDPAANLWPVFSAEGLTSHQATFPSRADEYGDNCRGKLEAAQSVDPDALHTAYRAMTEWRHYQPDVDLYVTPAFGVELPPDDGNEMELRATLPAFLRPINFLGWAGLAIGELQFVAPTDEMVLAAGLAWERG